MDSERPPKLAKTPRCSRTALAGPSPSRATCASDSPSPVTTSESNRPNSAFRGTSGQAEGGSASTPPSSPFPHGSCGAAPQTPVSGITTSYCQSQSPVSFSSARPPTPSEGHGVFSRLEAYGGFVSLPASVHASTVSSASAGGSWLSRRPISVRRDNFTSFPRAAPLPFRSPTCSNLRSNVSPFQRLQASLSTSSTSAQSSPPSRPPVGSPSWRVAHSPSASQPSPARVPSSSHVPAFSCVSVASTTRFPPSVAACPVAGDLACQNSWASKLSSVVGTMDRLPAHPLRDSSEPGSSLRLRGLENRKGENNCFLNVVLQAFWNLRSFRVLCQHAQEHRHPTTAFISAAQIQPTSLVTPAGIPMSHTPSSGAPADPSRNVAVLQSACRLPAPSQPKVGSSVSESDCRAAAEPLTLQALSAGPARAATQEKCEKDLPVGRRSDDDQSVATCCLSGVRENSPGSTGENMSAHLPLAASCVFCAVKNLFANYQFGSCEVLPAAAVRASLASCWASTRFMPGDMEDADETLVGVLDALHAWHQGLNGPLPSASLAPLVPVSGAPFPSPRHRPPEDLSNPLDFLAFFRDIPCNPPCLSHALFALHLLFLPRCTSCGATGEPLLQQMYVHRVYAAELLPLLGTPAPAVASVCSAPASSPPLLSAPRSPRFQLKNEKPGNSCRQTGTASRKLISDSMSNAFPSSVNRTSGSSACVNLDFSTLSPRQHAFVGKQRASPSGPFPSYASERNTIPVKQEVHSAAAKTYESSPSACRQNGTIGGCLRALFLSDASLVSREAMAISPLHQPVGTDLPSFTLMHRSSTDKGAPMQKQNSTAYDFIFGTHAQTEDSRDDSWGNVDSGGSLSLEADLQKFQQLFQLTKAIRLAPRGSRAKQKGAAFRKGIGGGETGDKGGSLADGNPWDALSTRKQRGDCGQCRGSQTVTLDRHCMHAPTIFVCSLVWPPDFAQLPASSSASGESSCRAATPRSSPIKGVKTQDELRERVLLLLQGLEPVLDVPAIFSEMDSPRRPGSSPVLAHNVGGETASSAQTRRDPSGRRPFRAAAAREVEAFSADVAGKHVFSSSSSASFPPSAVSTTSPLTSVFMSNSEFLSNPCSPSIPLAEVFGRGVALRDDPERNTPGSRTTGEEFFSSSDSEREAEPSLPSDAWNRFLSGNDNGGQRKSDEEYGKEGLQLFCAEMLSCQSFSLSDLSDKAAKRGVSSVPVGCGVEDSTSAAAPCRVS